MINKAEKRQHIQDLANHLHDENALQQVIAALDDDATLYTALRTLKHGNAEGA